IPEFPIPKTPLDPGLHRCVVDLPDGCYRITFTPNLGNGTFRGTLRVDRAEGAVIVSGDLYFFPVGADKPDLVPIEKLPLAALDPGVRLLRRFNIPIYPRNRYHSYLKATQVRTVSFGHAPCRGSFTFQQYDYTQPPAGSFNGTFPASPGSRTAVVTFAPKPAPSFLWPGNYYEGEWSESGISKGTVTLGWVSSSLRRCTVEVDTLVGAVSPQPVPASSGSGTESFTTVLATAGWQATVVYDQTGIPKPASPASATDCWSDADLHALMQTVRKPSTNLDNEWHMHVLVVPGHLGCSRGKMYDMIDVPREGVVSYSDDGYPTGDSAHFGAAANGKQRDFPRAFLRSASHEVTHGFNQIHQEQEGGADNSIMTTTPSVADVLAASSPAGTFPDDIHLGMNARVRHHLAHFPDPVVRPGGHTFASWASVAVPSADRFEVGPDQLTLAVSAMDDTVALGEPVLVSWVLTNTSGRPASVPSDVSTRSTYARLTVIDAIGRRHVVTPFVIDCERTSIRPLPDGQSVDASERVFWSSNGFPFERPGRYTVEVAVDWTVAGTPLTIKGETSVFVGYPTSATANDLASTLLHPEVGKWVALGGGAFHLPEAVSRLQAATDLVRTGDGAGDGLGAIGALRGFAGILPGDAPAPSAKKVAKKAAGKPAGRPAKKAAKPARKRG
ncbi:MAG TPA: hypothetical protein VIJ47_15495, partial [Acidimicrobiales bacterium]